MGVTYCISLDFCQSQGHQQFSIVVTQLQAVFWTVTGCKPGHNSAASLPVPAFLVCT